MAYVIVGKQANTFYELKDMKSGKSFRIFHIKVPSPVNIRMKPQGPPGAIIPDFVSTVRTINRSYSEKDKIIKEYREHGIEVEVEQISFTTYELCQLCGKKGVPSIRPKNNDTFYYTNNKHGTEKTNKIKVKGKNPNWLTYSHPGNKRCWVQQWQGNINGTFKEKKNKMIDFRKYLISGVVKSLSE